MLFFLCLIVFILQVSSFSIYSNRNLCRNTVNSYRNLYMQRGKRKRRTKVKQDGKITLKKSTLINSENKIPMIEDNTNIIDDNANQNYINEFNNLSSSSSSSSSSTPTPIPNEPEISQISQTPTAQSYQSKLKPLSGTVKDKQMKFQEKNIFERNLEEFFSPTPVGQEPKLIQMAKTVTWGAVILLVLVEIVVSIKVGGAPFDVSKASVPDVTRMLKIK